MKHRRGIDLLAPIRPASYFEYQQAGSVHETLSSLREWEVLGAECAKCGHVAWLDKNKVARLSGNTYLMNLKLRCRCGNRKGNKVLVGKLGRD